MSEPTQGKLLPFPGAKAAVTADVPQEQPPKIAIATVAPDGTEGVREMHPDAARFVDPYTLNL